MNAPPTVCKAPAGTALKGIVVVCGEAVPFKPLSRTSISPPLGALALPAFLMVTSIP